MTLPNPLEIALASRDPAAMHAALAALPDTVLHAAAPEIVRLALHFEADAQLADARVCRDLVVRAWPGRAQPLLDRARLHLRMGDAHAALADCDAAYACEPALQGLAEVRAEAIAALTAGGSAVESTAGGTGTDDIDTEDRSEGPASMSGPAAIQFDPALLIDPAMPADIDPSRRDGIVQLLRRYSGQQRVRNTLHKLQDAQWLETWSQALQVLRGRRVTLYGSGLGVLALHALEAGAERVLCAEASAPSARIAAGLSHKNHLSAWHARHGDAAKAWDQARQREHFEAFTEALDIAVTDDAFSPPADSDAFVFTDLDHTLLGTGIVPAVRRFLSGRGPDTDTLLLPARATVHAMAVTWCDPDPGTDLSALRPLRWSPYPQPFDLPQACWRPLTAVTTVATIDFAHFAPDTQRIELPVIADGIADGIVYWYTLELGGATLSTAPETATGTLRPALQYLDAVPLRSGERFPLQVRIEDTRLSLLGDPPPSAPREDALPAWYPQMLADAARDAAYGEAIARAVQTHPADRVLNFGAGCGGMALALHRAGFGDITAAEHMPAIARAGAQVIAANTADAADAGIRFLQRDVRKLDIPDDMPGRAGLAVFDQFDCSLIGEGILHYLAHARQHLLDAGARLLPASAVLYAQVVQHRFDRLLGVDATLLNPFLYAPGIINVDADRIPWMALGEPVEVFRFDFATAMPEPQRTQIDVQAVLPPADGRGVAGAVLLWFDLQLDAQTTLSNAPGSQPAAHWKQGLHFLPELQVENGMRLPLVAEHDGSALKFSWDMEALDRTRLVQMPRFDPRSAMAASELEQSTRELLQHCAHLPEERQRVAEIALRIAVDPAAHGIDPSIAQRFASMFVGR